MTTTQGPSEHELNEDDFSWDEVHRVEWRPKSCEDHESEYFWFGFKQFKAFLRIHQHTSYGRIKGLWVQYRKDPTVVKRKARGGHQIAFRAVRGSPSPPFPPHQLAFPPPLQEMWGTTSRKGPGSGFWIV